ncbi:RNA polymerase sigma-70 factor, ECF subfamily [Filimonas lacunae]|uniref:RNA polymerase sigma-70 factor, ECF subfamily n=1 Tax=Filimonas lacunae TaxID=477680 RepID=A0A1N7N060_9BACT|nr:RNA polymerase sigma-70 factor [Filimonas lacunae]SIS91746.1 RNA polymerase sigma-70 factor, ECF subfamily [Filimonas lacunae]
MQLINEQALIIQLKEGDEIAFRELYHAYSEVLYSFLVKLNVQREDIKDVIQQTFTKLWENRSGLKEGLSLKAYLMTIAKNDIYNIVKKRLTEKKHQTAPQESEEPALQASEVRDLLYNILQELPHKRREVFTMSRIEGYSNKEIAEMLNITKSTVENHINLSTRQLKGVLKKFGFSE